MLHCLFVKGENLLMNILQVEFKNRSGYILRGIVTLPNTQGPVPFMVHLHGFGSNCSGYRSMNAHTSRVLAKQGIGSARFSFHGNGESDGDYEDVSFDGLYADAEDIFAWVANSLMWMQKKCFYLDIVWVAILPLLVRLKFSLMV